MELTPQRWTEIQAIFHQVVDLPAGEQDAALRPLCGPDDDLRLAVLELLSGERRADSIIERHLDTVAANVLGSPDVAPARQYGRYRVIKLIGEGGMGVVYLASREDLGQTVALKVLRQVWLSPIGRERFAIEQRSLARLSHRAIAALYDADTLADGTPWFALEFVQGRGLTQYCAEKAASFTERIRLFREVCEAVQHAHQHMIVHRDLKPSNILVTDDGHVKLLDFGIAKQLDDQESDPAARTKTASRFLTPNYAAPEQLTGGSIGVHTDVYALGVLLYELVTGRWPLDLAQMTIADAQQAALHQQPARPSVVAREQAHPVDVDRPTWMDLDVLLFKALHKDFTRRYPTVEAMMRDLDHLVSGRPLDARPDSIRYRAGKFVRRHRTAAIALAGMTAIVTGLVGFYTVRLRSARNEAVSEAARTSRTLLFMEKLFEGGDADDGPASDLRVLTLVDRGAREARSLQSDPAIQAELYQTLGTIYQNLGELDKANELLQASLDDRRAGGRTTAAETAQSLIALSLLRSDQAKLEEAESLARAGLEMAARVLPPNHPTVARAKLALGKILSNRGDFKQAVVLLDEAVAAYSQSPATATELGVTLTILANTHYYAGRSDLSEAINRRVLAIDRVTYGNAHPSVADDLINLGAIEDDRGKRAEAAAKYREALAIFEHWYGPNNPETASVMTMLAQVLVREKKLDEALDLFRRALQIHKAKYGDVHPRVAMAQTGIGLVAFDWSQLDEAETSFQTSKKIYDQVYKGKHSRIGAMLMMLASVQNARRNPEGAERFFREALEMYVRTLPADHATTAIARVKFGHFLVEQRRFPEAEEQLILGRDALQKESPPRQEWMRPAFEDLALVYESSNRPEEARKARLLAAGLPPPGQ